MPEKPETIPEDPAIEAVSTQVVDRLVQRLANEVKHPLVADVSLVKDGVVVRGLGQARSGDLTSAQKGEVRLRFRSTYFPDRHLFFVDSVFDRDARSPSLSGFLVRGDVRRDEDVVVASFNTWVVKRNDWDWSKWL